MNKGFTLIELLAVIVILAIIALIATPLIINIIEDSKKQSIISSAQLYVDGLIKQIASMNMKNEFNPSSCTITNGNISCDGQSLDYTVDGQLPTSGTISFGDGVITNYTLCIGGYKITRTGNNIVSGKDQNCSVTFGGTFVDPSTTDTHLGVAYLDPTNLSNTCTAQLAAANVDSTTNLPTGITSGCMKFYVYADDGANYTMILDHNTSGDVYWNSNGVNTTMTSAADRLTEDTMGWNGNPRFITADEVAHIVGADSEQTLKWVHTKNYGDTDPNNLISWFYFDSTGTTYSQWQTETVSSTVKSKYWWLYDYTYECNLHGCLTNDNNTYPYPTKNSSSKSQIYGYWTSTPVVGSTIYVWGVNRDDCLYDRLVNDDRGRYGIRPVITLPKSIFE